MTQSNTEIDALVSQQDQMKLFAKLERLIDEFLSGASHYSNEQIATFDEVIGRIASKVDVRALTQVSQRLATERNAPPGIIRQLAKDDRIDVAEPVLVLSECLEESALIDIVATQTQSHLLAISKRATIGAQVLDGLIRRGNQSVIYALYRNKKAKFSATGAAMLARRIHALRQEKRRAARRVVNYPAMVLLEESGERLACTLIDVSKTGAKLALTAQRRLPEIVLLNLAGNGGAIRKCAVAWQNALQVGLRFIS